jgi:hypothetical protein
MKLWVCLIRKYLCKVKRRRDLRKMRMRRLFVSVGAPLILVVGLGGVWVYRQGSDLVHQIETWGDQLEHSSEPVELNVAGFPIISTMYVDGTKVGKLDRVIVMRQAPGDVDSLRIVVTVEDAAHMKQMEQCKLQMDPDALEDTFPLEGWKHIMHCASDEEGLVPFGTVVFEGADHELTLLLDKRDLPCGHMSKSCGEMTELRADMRRLRDEIRTEVRKNVRVRVKN